MTVVLFSLAFVGLAMRLVQLQACRHEELSRLADANTHRAYWEAPRRGDIVDINNSPMAITVEVRTVCADPSLIGDMAPVVAQELQGYLPVPFEILKQKLSPARTVGRDAQGRMVTNEVHYVRLAQGVSEETWQQIHAAMTNLDFGAPFSKLSRQDRQRYQWIRESAIFAETQQRRNYPNGALAGQVLGFCGMEDQQFQDHDVSQLIGKDGIEQTMNATLTGVPGWRVTEIDRAQRELVSLRDEDVPAEDGLDVALTLDSGVQLFLENALQRAMADHHPKSVTGIVVRPSTGEILAMASMPNFDPNNLSTISAETRNRLITDVMEPGSTFKIVVVSGALEKGVVRLTDTFDCEHGHFAYAGRVLHDHEPFGILTTEGIITKSSNIGAAKIGLRLGAQDLYNFAWNYGFGQRTDITLPGEARGFLYPVRDWSKVSIVQIPMGHGVAVTRLQMVMAMCAIANHGWLMHPMIINRIQRHNQGLVQQYLPSRIRQVVGDATCRQMIEALKTVVTKDGTAEGAAMADYVVAGKTGTAQKAEHGAYVPGKYFSSFIGFFPADDPQLCISIVMDEPQEGYYGGKVCGPVFKDVAEHCASYFNIPPDPERMTNREPLVAESHLSHRFNP